MFDFNATYVAEGWGAGIAWRATHHPREMVQYGPEEDETDEYWGECWEETVNTDRVVAHMVGDDSNFEFDISDLTKIDEDDYCHECGQVGCTHDGRVREN